MAVDAKVEIKITLDEDGEFLTHPIIQGLAQMLTQEEDDFFMTALHEALEENFQNWEEGSNNRAAEYKKEYGDLGIQVTKDEFVQHGYRPPDDTIKIVYWGSPDNPEQRNELL